DSLVLIAGENRPSAAVIDTAAGFAYFGTQTDPGIIIKIGLSNFTRVGALSLNIGETSIGAAVIDITGDAVYFAMEGTYTNVPAQGVIVKLRLSDFSRAGALSLNVGEENLGSAAIDPAGGYAYFGAGGYERNTGSFPASLVKVRLADFTR